jgi:hypothetical protein
VGALTASLRPVPGRVSWLMERSLHAARACRTETTAPTRRRREETANTKRRALVSGVGPNTGGWWHSQGGMRSMRYAGRGRNAVSSVCRVCVECVSSVCRVCVECRRCTVRSSGDARAVCVVCRQRHTRDTSHLAHTRTTDSHTLITVYGHPRARSHATQVIVYTCDLYLFTKR